MRAFFIVLFNVIFLLGSVSYAHASSAPSNTWIDTTKLNKGIVSITYIPKKKIKTKVRITKGNEYYTYNLTDEIGTNSFSLQLGNGDYKVMILEHVSDKSYKVAKQTTIKLNLKDEKVIYLNSIQNVHWTNLDKPIILAKELVKNKKTDTDKAKAIYDYIITNIAYDHKLAEQVQNDYLPDIERTFTNKKDICYGYAALYAAMLRSLDIPTRLVMGDSEYVDVYHAWNEVYLDGEWVIIDTTVDAGIKKNNATISFIKNANKYTPAKIY